MNSISNNWPWPAPGPADLILTLTTPEAAVGREAFKDDVTIVVGPISMADRVRDYEGYRV